jgi:hypothetical protein
MLSRFPVIDYEKHPAFERPAASGVDDEALAARVQALDRLRAGVEQGQAPERDLAAVLRDVDLHVAAIAALFRASDLPAVLLELALASIAWTAEELSAWLHFAALRRPDEDLGSTAGSLSALKDSGCCMVEVSPSLKRRFIDDCRPLIDALRREQPRHQLTRNCLEVQGVPLKALRRLVADCGADRIMESYVRSKVSVGAGIELSHAAQKWDDNIYAAQGVPQSNLRYLHTDESPFVPKAMLYLTEVTPESGPTSFIPGSNLAQRSEFQQMFFKAFDRVTTNRFLPLVEGRYRPFFRLAETRRLFMALPRLLRGSSHFGDDLLNGEPLEAELSRLETPFLENSGATLCLFDGARTLHRGSNIRRGERIGVQLVFVPTLEKRARLKSKGVDTPLALARLLYGEARKYV